MVLIMVITGLLRTSTSAILRSSKSVDPLDRQNKSVLQRCSRLRASGGFVSPERWEARRSYWTAKETGGLREKGGVLAEAQKKGEDGGAMPGMPNPAAAMEGMMGNASFMIQNMVMMQGIQHFFSGYVLVKVPFPLTKGFKQMFQRGVDLPQLETSYVSSVSWYFLVMFGLRGFFRLVIGDPTPDSRASNLLQTELGNTLAQQQPFKAAPAFKAECDNLEMARYRGVVEASERRLLGGRWPKARAKAARAGKGGRGDDIFSADFGKKKVVPALAEEPKGK
jgi:hypothetical protein